jgi:hypothetical protein
MLIRLPYYLLTSSPAQPESCSTWFPLEHIFEIIYLFDTYLSRFPLPQNQLSSYPWHLHEYTSNKLQFHSVLHRWIIQILWSHLPASTPRKLFVSSPRDRHVNLSLVHIGATSLIADPRRASLRILSELIFLKQMWSIALQLVTQYFIEPSSRYLSWRSLAGYLAQWLTCHCITYPTSYSGLWRILNNSSVHDRLE